MDREECGRARLRARAWRKRVAPAGACDTYLYNLRTWVTRSVSEVGSKENQGPAGARNHARSSTTRETVYRLCEESCGCIGSHTKSLELLDEPPPCPSMVCDEIGLWQWRSNRQRAGAPGPVQRTGVGRRRELEDRVDIDLQRDEDDDGRGC